MAKYKKGPWDDHLDGLMDMTACCSVAHEELDIAELLDHEMDRHQEVGYRYLRMIFHEPDHPETKARAEAALNAFTEAERLESLMEAHVRHSDQNLQDCKETSVDLTQDADEHRRADAGLEPLGLTVPQVAKMLQLGKNTVREQLASGEIPGLVKFGRSHRVSKSVLTEWMAERHENGVEAA